MSDGPEKHAKYLHVLLVGRAEEIELEFTDFFFGQITENRPRSLVVRCAGETVGVFKEDQVIGWWTTYAVPTS